MWPENKRAARVFQAMRTQWRVGMGGRTGLDYGVLPAVMQLLKVPKRKRDAVFADVRHIEAGALEAMQPKD